MEIPKDLNYLLLHNINLCFISSLLVRIGKLPEYSTSFKNHDIGINSQHAWCLSMYLDKTPVILETYSEQTRA
jgi:hypothetical protein